MQPQIDKQFVMPSRGLLSMIFSTSRNSGGVLSVSLVRVLSVMVLTAAMSQSDDPPASTTVVSRIIATAPLHAGSRPQWARFSPVNSHLILVDLDGQGLLFSIPPSTSRPIDKGLSPIGWLGESLVVRDQRGTYRLLNPGDLTPTRSLTVGSLPLPWTFGKDHRMRFQMTLPENGTAGIPLMPRAKMDGSVLTALEDRAAVAISSDNDGHNVVNASGRVVFQGNKKIYGITLSPDGYKMLVYYGNTEYVLFNLLTRRSIRLPPTIHAWTWLTDSSTLLGDVSVSQPNREEVTATELYIYELASARLSRIALPASVRGVALKILDVSQEGTILVEAERVVPTPSYLGLMILEVVW
jgi:hypothetical protein